MYSTNGGSQYDEESKIESESSESDKEDDESAEEEETLSTQPELGIDVSTETDNNRESHAKAQTEESSPQKKTMSTAMQTRKQKLLLQRQDACSAEELQPGENEPKQE